MPIYEYECSKCGSFEVTQKITERPLGRCPTCKAKVKKLISNTSFQLKGTGWYVTDYARKDNGKDSKAAKASSADKADKKEGAKASPTSDSGDKSSGKKTEASSPTST